MVLDKYFIIVRKIIFILIVFFIFFVRFIVEYNKNDDGEGMMLLCVFCKIIFLVNIICLSLLLLVGFLFFVFVV